MKRRLRWIALVYAVLACVLLSVLSGCAPRIDPSLTPTEILPSDLGMPSEQTPEPTGSGAPPSETLAVTDPPETQGGESDPLPNDMDQFLNPPQQTDAPPIQELPPSPSPSPAPTPTPTPTRTAGTSTPKPTPKPTATKPDDETNQFGGDDDLPDETDYENLIPDENLDLE